MRQDAPPVRAIARWHDEHRDFLRLLGSLEREVDIFHAGGQPDYERMRDIIHYLQHYTDESHHPREDMAFRCLAHHRPDLQLPLARLRQEHRVIAHLGQQVQGSLEQVTSGVFLERKDLEALAATYLVYYRSHIAREEEDVLPAAARLLTPADWIAVERPAPADESSEARFRYLRGQIERET